MTGAPPVTVIEAERGIAALRLGRVWAYRELLYFMGAAWPSSRNTSAGTAW